MATVDPRDCHFPEELARAHTHDFSHSPQVDALRELARAVGELAEAIELACKKAEKER